MGLNWAFLSRGVPTVVATLWIVDDEYAPRIMGEFYRELAKNVTPAAALATVMRSQIHKVPIYYWAPFVVTGYPGKFPRRQRSIANPADPKESLVLKPGSAEGDFYVGHSLLENGYPRHMDMMWPLYNLLDMTPDGRGDSPIPLQNYEHTYFTEHILPAETDAIQKSATKK